MALTIATGFVVDDAIVMIENIIRFMEQGETPLQAALKGAGQIGFTILSLTISLIAVLIPLLFMEDVIGRIFREFAITLAVAILISGFVSVTLTPMLCSRILRHRSKKPSRFVVKAEALQNAVLEHYRRSLKWVLQNQKSTLIVFGITVLLAFISVYFIPKGFFPVEDTGVIQGISLATPSISFAKMAEQQQAITKVILQDPAVDNVSSFIGIDGINMATNSGRMLINLKPLDERPRIQKVIKRLHNSLTQVPGITLYMQPLQDLTVDDRITPTQYQYSLASPNADAVTKWSNLLVEKLKESPLLHDVNNDQQNFGLQTMIDIDRDTAARLGITPQTIDNILYDAFGQRQIATLFTEINQYRVIMEALPSLQLGPGSLSNIYLTNANGTAIPLRTFTQISDSAAPLVINRQGQFPVGIVSFNLAPGKSLSAAIRAINEASQAIHIPINVQTSFEGAAKVFQNSLNNEGWLMLAAILTVYIILGMLYESYIHPLTILSTLPSACLGALLALWLTNNHLTIVAVIGIVLLIGIVLKNAILMIDFALELERVENKSPQDAIFEASVLRFRPILMTTIVAMLGAVPLALSFGMGAELRRPLGIVIIAGLIVSQLLTLYTTPVIYLAFDKLLRWVQRNQKKSIESGSPQN